MGTSMIILAAAVGVFAGMAAYAVKASKRINAEDDGWRERISRIVAENEKTPEGRERNKRFMEFMHMHGFGRA